MARPEGFEPPTPRSVVWCSVQLSYGRVTVIVFVPRARELDISITSTNRDHEPRRMAEREGFEPSVPF